MVGWNENSGLFKGTTGDLMDRYDKAMWHYKQKRLAAYIEAEMAILTGQSYTLEGRTLTRADLNAVRRVIDDLLADGVTLEGDEVPKRRQLRTVFLE